jgi:hypothetical protein
MDDRPSQLGVLQHIPHPPAANYSTIEDGDYEIPVPLSPQHDASSVIESQDITYYEMPPAIAYSAMDRHKTYAGVVREQGGTSTETNHTYAEFGDDDSVT